MNVLLIWEDIPDSTIVYFLEDVSEEERKILGTANDCFINSDDSEEKLNATYLISDAISSDIEYCQNKEWAGKWSDKIINLPFEPNKKIDLVVITGCVI